MSNDIKNNVKSTALCLTLNSNMYFELKKISDRKFQTVQEYIRGLLTEAIETETRK